jgi:hypothetical protein
LAFTDVNEWAGDSKIICMSELTVPKITSQRFADLYQHQEDDLALTPLADKYPGFTLVREYDTSSQYHKDGMKMFIRLYVVEDFFMCGNIEMVKESDNEGMYTLIASEKYKKRITGFWFGKEERIKFDVNSQKITVAGQKKQHTINEFIEILVKNHLADRLRWRRLHDLFIKKIIRFLFWLQDQKYDEVIFILRPNSLNEKHKHLEKKATEPFFNYFQITKNMLFVGVILAVLLSALLITFNLSYFTILNPLVPLIAFMCFFILEKVSIRLENSIEAFYKEDGENLIIILHNKLWRSNFKLKY